MRISRQIGRRLTLAGLIVVLGTVSTMKPGTTALAATNISVDTTHTLATVPSTAIGLNTAVWDGHLLDSGIPAQIRSTGTSLLRFPGGSTADAYHWQTNTLTPGTGGYVNPVNTFNAFMTNVVQPAGAGAMVTVNYGSNSTGTGGGDPAEAAAWVNAANNVHHYGVRYWEIGNEVYGNGYYGGKWETDLHSDHSPATYAQNALGFISAMKRADPTIKVGLVLTAPGNWPDGQGPQQWNPTVLTTACTRADFVSVHWYAQQPGSESDAGLLASTSGIAAMVEQLRGQLTRYCGSHGAAMGIFVTESNSVSYNPGKQTTTVVNGLFLLQDYLEWMKAGVQNVTWWDLHNGPATGNNNSGSLAGTTTYGDYGILSSGGSGQPAANSPFATYLALQLLQRAMTPGATFVSATSGDPTIQTSALVQPNGQLALVLVNTSASASTTVSPTIAGWKAIAGGTATSFELANPQLVTTSVTPLSGVLTIALAPYSATVLLLDGGTSATATATNTPVATVTPIASPTSTSTAAPTDTPTLTPTTTPTATASPSPTITSTPTTSSSLVLESFENGLDGFAGNYLVTTAGPSHWQPTLALGNSSLWVKYTIPTAFAEARLTKTVVSNVSAYSILSLSVFAKQPTTSSGVQVRFEVRGSDYRWHISPYTSVPIGTRTTVRWNIGSVPRNPLHTVVVCWRFTSTARSSGNEIWFDDLQASPYTQAQVASHTQATGGPARASGPRAL